MRFCICGLIPARAGKTKQGAKDPPKPSAHPRAGGENQEVRSEAGPVLRLIPARAGKTGWWGPSLVVRPAHPRAGGENRLDAIQKLVEAGSSPRGRGKPDTLHSQGPTARLIPARAGKTAAKSPR